MASSYAPLVNLLLVTLAVAALLPSTTSATVDSSIDAACKATLYPEVCSAAFASVSGNGAAKTPAELFHMSASFAMEHASLTRTLAYNLSVSARRHHAAYPPTGAEDCVELIDNTVELLSTVLDNANPPSRDDARTWLSAALTNQATCMESLATRPPAGDQVIDLQSVKLMQLVSNSLALLGPASLGPPSRRLTENADGFPAWLSEEDRRLLTAAPEDIKPNAVVAQDGTGTHRSINEALAFVSLQQAAGGGRSVISIKAGTYKEYIRVQTKQKNVMLIGAGKGVSVIVGDRSVSKGWTTYESATVAANGAGFIARDLTIINSAGSGSQAVALRVGADLAVVYKVSVQGYQDSLYAHKNRQFYREIDVYGTVDFIFGNAAAVIQSSSISPRRPNVANTITAQSRQDPNQNTGFVIQGCRITAASDLVPVKRQFPTYFGRPWKAYSRVVIMQSYIDDSVNARGWEPWAGGASLNSVYYAEYGNTGPGAGTAGRVRAAGVRPAISATEAAGFTVNRFINGGSWIPATGVPFGGGL